MTKRDYECIASVIAYEANAARQRKDIASIVTVSRIATHMCAKLAVLEPRFDVDKFLAACSINE